MNKPLSPIRLPGEETPLRWVARKVARYGFAAIGPVGAAATQFLLSLVVLHRLPPAEFGAFTFLLVTSNFSNGIWSALFCAPLPVVTAGQADDEKEAILKGLFTVCLIVAGLAFVIFWGLGASLNIRTEPALLFAGYGTLALLRWLGRAYAYVTARPARAVSSDIVYSLVLAAGITAIAVARPETLLLPHLALMLAAAIGLLPLGGDYLRRQFLNLSLRETRHYRRIWRHHSSWSLLGVVTTEATANAHAYLLTFFLGPAAFAPISASALLMRPIGVVTNALTDFERPQMARQIAAGDIGQARRSVRWFRLILVALWIANCLAAMALFALAPGLIFPSRYSTGELAMGAGLWMAVAAVRLLRQPDSVLMQAGGMFRPLAYASVVSCGISIAAVASLLVLAAPLWSILGILFGEFVCAVVIWRQTRRWLATRSPLAASAGAAPDIGPGGGS